MEKSQTENKVKTATEQIELINQAIRLTQLLRTHICHVFREVGNGSSDSSKTCEENQEQGADEENKKSLLKSLRHSIEVVDHDIGELEKGGQSVVPVNPSANCNYISLDPILDRTSLYSQVNLAYKRANKMHECATLATNILVQNPLKRSAFQNLGPGVKRTKRPTSSAGMVPQTSHVDQVVAAVDRMHPNMRVTLSRPLGNCAVMHVVLGRVLKAQMVLRGLVIEWVKVKGYNEEFTTADGKVDLWTKSRYEVFLKISDHAAAAMLHYYAPTMPDIGVRPFTARPQQGTAGGTGSGSERAGWRPVSQAEPQSLMRMMLWLQGYSKLFSVPCAKCGKFLRNAMPPTWRDFRTLEPFHDECRQ